MYFEFSEDQRQFQRAVADVLAGECPHEKLAAAWDTESGRVAGLWAKLAELGIVGLTTPEEHGGLGLGPLDLALVLEECGRFAVPEPVIDIVGVAAPLLARAGGSLAGEWLPRIASGEARVALGLDDGGVVDGAAAADLLLLRSGRSLHAVPRAAAELTAEESVDGGRRSSRVSWTPTDATSIATDATADALVGEAFNRGAAGAAAELLGAGRHLIDLTVEYAKERVQFGQAIGAFQAVKHHLANAHVRLEMARPAVYHAAYAVQTAADTVDLDVSTAKALVGDAAHDCFRVALQCHGAIAYTYEYHAHMWMKRVLVLERRFGDAAWHRRRAATALLDGPAEVAARY